MTRLRHLRTAKANPDGQAGVTTRQARAVIVVVAVVAIALFVSLRAGRDPADGGGRDQPAVVAEPGGEESDATQAVDAPVRERPGARYVIGDAEFEDAAAGLAAADEALADGRLYQPEGDNALEYYLGVATLEPDNEAAQEGLVTVRTLLADRLWQAMAQHDLDEAASLLALLTEAGIDADRAAELETRLERLQRAEDFVFAAREDIEAGRLDRPSGANALARIRRARELDPENPSLPPVLDRFATAVVEASIAAAREQRFGRALGLLERAAEVLPGSRALADARAEIGRFRDQQIQSLGIRARAAMAAADFEQAEQLIEEARRVGAGRDTIVELREALRHATIYGRFDARERFRDELTGGRTGPEMIVIPHGSFLMGSDPDEDGHDPSEAPRHRVYFARAFALSRTEITVAEFESFVRATGYRTDAESDGFSYVYNESNGRIIQRAGVNWRHDYRGREAEPELPVVHVSWNDARAYARWLASVSGKPYRLPSEAEFEYALRGDTTMRYWWGNGSPDEAVENLTGERDRSGRSRRVWNRAFQDYGDGYWGPAPVGSLAPNPFGLLDMAGNVEEWVADCWHDSYVRAPLDGSAWVNPGCGRRVLRGGFWGGDPHTARSAYRTHFPAEQRGSSIGFRIARDLY